MAPDTPSSSSPAPADDPLTAALEEIRELASKRDETLAWVARASADDGELDAAAGAFEVVQDKLAARVPRLLAAIYAVLKLHRRDHHKTPFCEECGHVWPCSTYRVTTRELTGKEEPGA